MDKMFTPAAEPPTALGRFRTLGPNCGLKVSPLCLGAMNFGEGWEQIMGKCDKKTSFEILDTFYQAGGNFIDTANNYQNEESELWIGEWMAKHANRDEMVIATKYTMDFKLMSKISKASYAGNSYKNMRVSVEASLKKLQTSYVDILYVHLWDWTTPVEEVMSGLNQLVREGKVLYLGISDTPAWVVAKANMYARQHGMAQFAVYQGRWNAADRAIEREVVPMAREFGMAVAPWGSLGGGGFKTAAQREDKSGRKMGNPSETDLKVSEVLEKIAKNKGTAMTSVAMAYVMHAYPYTFPIVGGRKAEHLRGNIEAINLKLTPEELEEISDASGFVPGFPHSVMFMGAKPRVGLGSESVTLIKSSLHVDTPSRPSFH